MAGLIADLASLMKARSAYGLKVSVLGAIERPLLPGRGTALIVNGDDLQVFEYADNTAVQAALAMINPDGSLVDVDIDWDGSPHFYQSGRIIALYVEDDDTIKGADQDVGDTDRRVAVTAWVGWNVWASSAVQNLSRHRLDHRFGEAFWRRDRMASILFGKLRTLLAIVAVLLLLVACGAAETGGAPSAPSAQPTITPAATAEPTAQPAPTVAPTQASAGATEPTGSSTAVTSHGGPVKDQVSPLDALRKAGATVQVGEQAEQPFLSVAGNQITINGTDMQVFEYADEAAAQADAAKTTDILAGRSTMMIDWVGSPHAYRAGRVIVLYIGDDPATLKLLQETLGAPFAEHKLLSTPQPSAAPTASSSTATQSTGAVSDKGGFVDRLRADGLDVKSDGEVEQLFFDVPGTGLTVNGADVQVFEFADAAAAKGAVSKIGADGNPQGAIVEWVAPPHFYQAGRIVVLYVGEDKTIIEALTKTLGTQVAGR